MFRRIEQIVVGLALALVTEQALAFSLVGPGEAWQTTDIGYRLAGDIGGVQNLGEEYRWNTPLVTYGFDESFINYFGTNGVLAIDSAIRILNNVPPVSQMTPTLGEFSLDTKRVNYRAGALGLVDIKSTALWILLEHMGLAEAERYVWTLRQRTTSANPDRTNYLTIKRNFDPITFTPSSYVNDVLYTYRIFEYDPPPPQSEAVEIPVDPTAISFTSVSGGFIFPGDFYTGITRDDAGGLRYLYNSKNVNVENPLPNTLVAVPSQSTTNLVLITNLDLALFNMRAATSPPAILEAFYPGLVVTNTVGVVAITNRPVIAVTNDLTGLQFTNRNSLLILSNQDLGLFTQLARTNPPAALQTLYPGLVITATNLSVTSLVQVASITITNEPPPPWLPAGAVTNFIVVTNFVTNLVALFDYQFGSNFVTFASNNQALVVFRTTDVRPSGFGGPNVLVTNITDTYYLDPNRVSGSFLIRPPTLAGYEPVGTPLTNIITVTNVLAVATNTAGGFFQAEELTFFTNILQAAFPIQFVPGTPRFVTNTVTEFITFFQHQFQNAIFTNVTTDTAIRQTLVITPSPLGPPNPPQTNITSFVLEPIETGGVIIINTNLAGFDFTGLEIVNYRFVTNILLDVTNTITGEQIQQQLIYLFPEVVRAVFPIAFQTPPNALRPGVDKVLFAKVSFDSILGTNLTIDTTNYVATALSNFVTYAQTFRRTINAPDILFTAEDLGTVTRGSFIAPVRTRRTDTTTWANNNALNGQAALAGPGVIQPQVIVAFNKLGPSFYNQFPGSTTEGSSTNFFSSTLINYAWGYFDGSTNPPAVFPQDVSLQDLEDRIFRRAP